MKKLLIAAASLLVLSCNTGKHEEKEIARDSNSRVTGVEGAPPAMSYNVVNVYPHDTSSYTEGLFFKDGQLYESTGREGFSKVARINLADGKPVQEVRNTKDIFGEGISILNGKLFELTYQTHKVFVYDPVTFKQTGTFEWNHEGWGMTTDGTSLILSEGSSNIYYVNPADFSVRKIVSVTNNYGPVGNVNELEYVDGFIYANVYETDDIIKIDPQSGRVVAKADMKDIFKAAGKEADKSKINDPTQDVLNGIAYNPANKHFYVTGKCWPWLFELTFQ